MNKIQKYALEHAEINLSNLVVILEALEERRDINLEHVLEVILGMKDNELSEEIPEKAVLDKEKSKVCRFKSYNILTDSVEYEYDDILRLWFRNEADAKAFEDGESYYNRQYRYSNAEDYQYSGEKPIVCSGCCLREEWIEGI